MEPRNYRFRILNASNLRGYELRLSNGGIFYQIGTDLGLKQHPVELDSFFLEPAERIDLIIDFAKYKGQEILLMNDAPAPPNPGTEQIMKFIVSDKLVSPDKSEIPNEMMHFHKINPSSAVKERTMHLDETIDHYGRTMHLLNNKTWDEPATERPKMDTVEIWHLVNHFDFPHPIHIHLVRFEVLEGKSLPTQILMRKVTIYSTRIACPLHWIMK